MAPDRRVAVLEAGSIGSGASGRTGGLILDESAAGDLPGLGNVLDGFLETLNELGIDADVRLTGVWELSRTDGRADSPFVWRDSGELRVADESAGGTFDPGKLVDGLARAARLAGVTFHENVRVRAIRPGDPVRIDLGERELAADRVLIAANARGADLVPRAVGVIPRFTVAVLTEPFNGPEMKPFYTLDLPYLWGRPFDGDRMIFGGGVVPVSDPAEFDALDVEGGEVARLISSLEERIRGLDPAMASITFSHRWGGPVLSRTGSRPLFRRHPESDRITILGSWSGHGNALTVHLSRWVADVVLGRREPPAWGGESSSTEG